MTLQDRLGAPAYAERYGGLVRDFHTMVKDQPPPKDWIILGLLIRARHLVLAGQAGSLKTMLLWQLCVQLIQDRPDEFPHDLGILPPRAENAAPAKVAIVDGEMGPEQYHERAWDTGLKDYVLRGRLKYIDAGRLDIVNPDDCEYLMEELDGYDLVILDSLKGLTPSAAENDNDEMASVVKSITQMARALNAGIATIHHWGKEDAYRGASAILDQCDAMVAWKKHNPKNDDGYRCLSARGRHQKIRFAKEPPDRWFRLLESGLLIPSGPPEEGPSQAERDHRNEIVKHLPFTGTKKALAKSCGVRDDNKTWLAAYQAVATKVGDTHTALASTGTAPDGPPI